MPGKRIAKNPEQVGPKDESLLNASRTTPQQDSFLKKISNIESSSGQNLEHPTVTSGIQAGDTAVGQYGLMPNSIDELAKRAAMQKNAPLVVQRMKNMQDPQKEAQMVKEDPELEDLYAKVMAQHVLGRQGGDEDKAAYSWNKGSNLKPEDISQDQLDNSDYVQKFRKLKGVLGEE